MNVRNYRDSDYESIVGLYKNSNLYGGQFDENRDSKERLLIKIKDDPEAILICESESRMVGTVSIIEDGRVAWLFRFAVLSEIDNQAITKLLFERASEILKTRGHQQVLVYSPVGNKELDSRYLDILDFQKGTDYTCFWKDI